MKIAFFSAKSYEVDFFNRFNIQQHSIKFIEAPLQVETAPLVAGCDAVCVFVNDTVSSEVLQILYQNQIKLIALRCAGYNNVNLQEAKKLGITVVRVPAYSPHAVAEHTIALILTLNRKTHRAFNRVRESNFSLQGLMGFDLNGKTVGLIGLGKIGLVTAQILLGFGCKVLGYDVYWSEEAQTTSIQATDLETIYKTADIISLHCPLTPETYHIINKESIQLMKNGVMLINTSRGALIDTKAVIEALKSEKIGYLGLDVYEEEADLFFEDLSEKVIQDDIFMRLLTFPNVLITGHQAFFTAEAMSNIAATTWNNITAFEQKQPLPEANKVV